MLEKLGKSQELLKEIRDIMSSISEDTSSGQHTVVPNVDVWDTGKAIEQEYNIPIPQPNNEGGQGQAVQSGLGSAPDITGAG